MVGDLLLLRTVQGGDEQLDALEIVGVCQSRKYSLQPSVFAPITTWDEIWLEARGGAGASVEPRLQRGGRRPGRSRSRWSPCAPLLQARVKGIELVGTP